MRHTVCTTSMTQNMHWLSVMVQYKGRFDCWWMLLQYYCCWGHCRGPSSLLMIRWSAILPYTRVSIGAIKGSWSFHGNYSKLLGRLEMLWQLGFGMCSAAHFLSDNTETITCNLCICWRNLKKRLWHNMKCQHLWIKRLNKNLMSLNIKHFVHQHW